jgi:hypothetical protein
LSNQSLDKFGELLMKRVRDKSIGDWERIISGDIKGVTGERVKQQIALFTPEQKEILCKLIPQIIDTSLHNLLFTAEQERSLRILMDNPEWGAAQDMREISDGLAGELCGERGWIARFSSHAYPIGEVKMK